MPLDIDIHKTLRAGDRTIRLQARFNASGQRIVIIGPSGSGKSVMLQAIAGLIKPDRGHIRLGGTTLFDSQAGIDLPPQARSVAYLFQDYALFPHLNVRQNIGFGLRSGWRNPSIGDRHREVDYWLDAFELESVAHQYPDQLSGGQRQRAALARALVPHPSAMLLDEPFAALDPLLRARMRQELDALQRRLEVPMVMITHDPEDARVFGEHVFLLRHGAIDTSPEALAEFGLRV